MGLAKRYRIARTAGVRCSFFMPNMLRSLYQAEDSLPQETTTNAVYSVTCKTCDAEYSGETKRAIWIRETEHRDAVYLGQCAKSAVAEHVHDSVVPHEVNWSGLQVLDRAGRKMERKIWEAFHIYQRKPVMNRDTGVERSPTWNAILQSLALAWGR